MRWAILQSTERNSAILFHDATAATLGMARIWIFGLAILSRVTTPVWDVCLLPDYQAPGVMQLLAADRWVPHLSISVAVSLQAITLTLLVLVMLGMGPYHLLATLSCILLTLCEGLVRGNGVATHANIILLLSCYLLALFPAADALVLIRRRAPFPTSSSQYVAGMISLCVLFSLTYLFVGARRLSASGLAIYFDDSILCSVALRDAERGPDGGMGLWLCQSSWGGWALRLGFPVVTLAELLTPLCLISRPARWLWLAVMLPFHIGAGLIMGIWFPWHLALMPLLVLGIDITRWHWNRETKQTVDPQLRNAA
jgi:hypothetical protein